MSTHSSNPISVWILGDQLLAEHPAVARASAEAGRENVRVLLIENHRRAGRLPYQRKKLVLLFAAMRHYAAELREQGFVVDYVKSSRYGAALRHHLQRHGSRRLLVMASSSYAMRRFQEKKLPNDLDLPVTVLPNTQFLLGRYNPIPMPEPGKQYVLEYFYRDMRRHFDVLLDAENNPLGGAWNFDKENRRPLPADLEPPADLLFPPDEITGEVIAEIDALEMGTGTALGFGYAVTRAQAHQLFDDFLAKRLELFGPYEDALTGRSHTVYHAVLSPYLNIGLLEPLPLIRAAEKAYRDGRAPLNSVEGFIRQILGWREFMYWQYWRQMPDLLAKNSWGATRPVPDFFWTAETNMACLAHALRRAHDTGYNHHIERLMLLSNFLMLAGVNPRAANDWFLSLYVDAYDWVMSPNVIGMGLNADDGLTATKPYIASANYIDKMGDFCTGCRFDHKARCGEDACPFNFLYWNFILENEEKLRANPRLGRNVLGLRHLDEEERRQVREAAAHFLTAIS